MLRTHLTFCRTGVDLLGVANCQTLSSLLEVGTCHAHLKQKLQCLDLKHVKDSHFDGKALLLLVRQSVEPLAACLKMD